jgi:hypothetical protein
MTLLLAQGLAHEKLKQFHSLLIEKSYAMITYIPACSLVVAICPFFSMLLVVFAGFIHSSTHKCTS